MNLLIFSACIIICVATVGSGYPYEDTYTPGDIVPSGFASRYPNDRESGYLRKQKRGGYYGTFSRRNTWNGRHRDDAVLGRDYNRRYRDYDYYLPPRGIGGYRKHNNREYDYRRQRRPQVEGPPKYYDDDEINYGGYRKRIEAGTYYH